MDLQVWMRIGDQGDYDNFETPFQAGQHLASFTGFAMPDRYVEQGVEIADFTINNYVSLYWGDDDAQPVGNGNFNASDRRDFESGLIAGE